MATDDDTPAGPDGSELVGEFVRLFKRGQTWYANFQCEGKQHRPSLKTTSKKEARRRALQIEAELSAGRWKPTPDAATVEQAVSAYLDFLNAEDRSPRTLSKYTTIFARVAELACERRVKDLNGIDLRFIDAYRRKRSDDGIQATTKYTETMIIRQLVNFALSRDMIATDPLGGLKLKKPRRALQPCWTYEEVQRILAACPEDVRPPLTVLAETGMRFGEMAWLGWDDVDWGANLLRIQPKEGWKPKTGDQRAVPLNRVTLAVLASLPRRHQWVFPMPPTGGRSEPGRQWTEHRLLAALKRVLEELKLPGKLHTFRHTFISNAILKGTAEAVVREWVGHVDDEIIRHYTHVHSDASQAAMQRLARANQGLETSEDGRDAAGMDSAHTQHTRKEHRDETDAK
ncbi:MAG: integrase family protein [Gemmataceae bacterium]|nr:integrase family protein [Gemmataceae bacterium]